MSQDEQLWYQAGNWPLIGAVATTVAANGVLVWQTLKGFRYQRDEAVKSRVREFNNQCLERWYSPLFALLIENELVYEKFGPPSYVKLEYEKAGLGAARWKKILDTFVYPNQKKIECILKENIGFIHKSDNFNRYHGLLLHVISSTLSDALQSDLHKKFPYPPEVKIHIANKIKDIQELLQ